MATISSTISLVDDISAKLTTIKGGLDDVVSSFESLQGSFDTSQSKIDGFSWDTFTKNCEEAGKIISDIGTKMTLALTTPLVLLGKSLYSASVEHESAFAGVRKTVEATEEEYQALYDGMLLLSETETPVGFVDLAGIMEMAGQLGVAQNEVLGFTKTYADLQESTDIQGGDGAKNLQRFLNLTEQSTQNVARVGGVIVDLGNNFATTESEILAMATRMASTGDLAGFTSVEILALAAALSSAGIEAEAGGSSAGKLMKSMQLAAEMGAEAYNVFGGEYGSAVDFSYFIANSENLLGVAQELGVTTDYIEQLGQSWLDMEKFAEVSGKTADQFRADWANNPAQSMLDFFVGLGNLDESGQQSALSMLNEMGITEIRLSNLAAAMAGNSDLYGQALQMAYNAYMQDVDMNALAVEAGKRYSTQESKNAMLGNKLQNTMADFGDNLVSALQPALDCVNGLLEAFNALSESDQTKVIEVLGALALTGPIMTGIGATVTAVGKITGGIQTIITNSSAWGASLTAFFSNPVVWGVAAGAGILLLIDYLDSIPSKLEGIITSAAEIEISFDEESVTKALSQIEQIQSALDILNGNEATEDARLTSESVKMGWGTSEMYNTGLAYESAAAMAEVEQISNEYAAKILELQNKIMRSQDGEQNALWFEEIKGLETARDIDISAAQASYSAAITALFNGMAKQYPEEARELEEAMNQYDLMSVLQRMSQFDWDAYANQDEAQAEWDNLIRSMYSTAFDAGYMTESGYDTKDALMYALDNSGLNNELWKNHFYERVAEDLSAGVEGLSENPLAAYLATILSSDVVTENLDLTGVEGAFAGILGLLDFSQATQQAVADGNPLLFGDYLMLGLADGITNSSGIAQNSATTAGSDVITALAGALGVNSPSTFAIEQGAFVDIGLGQGITDNANIVINAVNAMGVSMLMAMMGVCNQVVAAGHMILNHSAGVTMGTAITSGMVSGIRSGQSAVVSAIVSMSRAAIAAAKAELQIGSPSKVFRGFGANSATSYVLGVEDNIAYVQKAMGNMLFTDDVWGDISTLSKNKRLSDSAIQKLRTLAEREVINRFTTAKLDVNFSSNNTISSEMDIDAVVDLFTEKISEQLKIAAEGVYE